MTPITKQAIVILPILAVGLSVPHVVGITVDRVWQKRLIICEVDISAGEVATDCYDKED